MVVIWTEHALNDLQCIYEYIEQGSPHYADKVRTEFFSLSEELSEFPELGRVVPEENDPNVRDCFLYAYRLIYSVDKDIEILSIVHMKQNISKKNFRN